MEMESGAALSIWVNSIKQQSGGEFGLFQQIQAVLASIILVLLLIKICFSSTIQCLHQIA